MDDAFGHFIAGFTAGEGTFCLHARPHSSVKGFNVTICFRIGLRDDDTEILTQIKEALGVGSLTAPFRYSNEKQKVTYNVARIKDLHDVIVPFFEKYPLRAKKARDFAIWKEAVDLLWEKQQRVGNERYLETEKLHLALLHDALQEVRRYAE